MELEERMKALEDEFQQVRGEMQDILFDIRIYLMGAQTPFPCRLGKGGFGPLGIGAKSRKADLVGAHSG